MVIASGEQRLARGRAERGGVEAVEFQAARREPLRRRRVARPPEGARRAEAHVVEQDDEDVRRALRRPQRLDGRKLGVRVLGIVGRQPHVLRVRDGENGSLDLFV